MTKLKKTPPPFSARDWVPLKAALRRIMSIAESYSRGLHYLTRDLRSGQLRSALEEISPDGKEMHTLLNPSDWRERTIYAEFNPENGVWVKPYVVGDIIVCRVDLDKWYPIAATPTMTTEAHPSDDTRPQERRRGPVLKHE